DGQNTSATKSARRVTSLWCQNTDAIGANWTWRERRDHVGLTRMTHGGHRPGRRPAAQQSPAVLRVCYLWPKPPEALMAQLTYDELRLLRQLERGGQTISDNQPRGGLDRLVDEGYVIRRLLNPSQTVHSITAKGRAAVHEAEGND